MNRLPWCWLLFCLAVSACSEYEIDELEAGLTLVPDVIDLGDVPVGGAAGAEIVLINIGRAPLVIEAVESSGDALSVQPPQGEIPAGERASAQVALEVLREGAHAGDVTFLAQGGLYATATWTAEGTLPDILVEPDDLTFATLEPGDTQQQALVVFNQGRAPLHVDGLSIDGAGGDCFAAAPLTRASPFALEPDTSETVMVTFAPPSSEPCEATLEVRSDDPDTPRVRVPMRGNLEPGNSRPAVSILAPGDGDEISLHQTFTLRAWVLDAETEPDQLAVSVHSARAGELARLSPDATGEVLLEMVGDVVGDDTLTVEAADPEGLSSADSVDITVTDCEEASWYREEVFDAAYDHTLFALNGDAYRDDVSEELVLTDALDWQAGAVYIQQPFLLQRFRTTIDLRIELGEGGADGLAVAWVGGAGADELLGQGGEALGVGELEGSYGYVVEVDVHNNSKRGDPAADHVALVALPDYQHVGDPVELEDLEDGVMRTLEVDFDMGELSVWLDGALLLDQVVEDYTPFEGYLGVTAATGSANNRHVIERWVVETGCW